MVTNMPRAPAVVVVVLAAVLAVLLAVPSPALAQRTKVSALPTDFIKDNCLLIKPDWNFCFAYEGAYIDLSLPSSFAYSTLWRRQNTSVSYTVAFDERFRLWLRGEAATLPGDNNATYPSWFAEQYGCKGYRNSLQRYLISMTCMNIIDRSNRCASLIASDKKPKVLCKSTCEAYQSGFQATFSNSTFCPGTNAARQTALTNLAATCNNANGPYGGPPGNCISGDTNEPNTCGYTEKSSICDASKCPTGAKTNEACPGVTANASSPTPSPDAGASSSSSNTATDAGNVSESSSGLGTGAIIGIVIGVLVVVAAAAFFVMRSRRGKRSAGAEIAKPRSGSWNSEVPQKPQQQFQQQPQSPYGASPQSPMQQQQQPYGTATNYGNSAAYGAAPLPPAPPVPTSPQYGNPQVTPNSFGNSAPVSPQQSQMMSLPASAVGANSANGSNAGMGMAVGAGVVAGAAVAGAAMAASRGINEPQQQQQQQQQSMPKANKRVSSMMMVTNSLSQHLENMPPVPSSQVGKNTDSMYLDIPVNGKQVRAVRGYNPEMNDEMELVVGDTIAITQEYDDGWAQGVNLSTGQIGVFPQTFVEAVATPEEPKSVKTRQSAYGDLTRLSQYFHQQDHAQDGSNVGTVKSVQLNVAIDSAPLDFNMSLDRDPAPPSSASAASSNKPLASAPVKLPQLPPLQQTPPSLVGQQQQQPQQAQQQQQQQVPADPSSINNLMSVLERIAVEDQQQRQLSNGQAPIPPAPLSPKTRRSLEAKVSRLPPEVRDSIVSQHENGQRFSFTTLMRVLDDPQLQHHESVYLDKAKSGNQARPDTLYSTYTFYEDGMSGVGAPAPPVPSAPQSAVGTSQQQQKDQPRPVSTLSDLDRWDAQLSAESEEMNRELVKLRQQQGGSPRRA
ncbi:JNK-interacting protein 1 [Allomyces arbusculus]|nr:JNK-interacting protein 1 [Allomyces arbusculus]